MRFFSSQVVVLSLIALFDKKQKYCVKLIHLVTDDGLFDCKSFYKVKNGFN